MNVSQQRVGLSTMIMRGLRKRCARCGETNVWISRTRMVDRCPACNHRFEREEGYWVGAIIINTAVTEALFAVLFVATIAATVPDVPWQPLLAVALVTNGIFPWIFYPRSKTVWVGLDLHFHRPARDATDR